MKYWTVRFFAMVFLAMASAVAGASGFLPCVPGEAMAAPAQSRLERFAEAIRQHPGDVEIGDVEVDQRNQTLEIRDIRFNEKNGTDIHPTAVRSVLFYDVDWDSEPAPTHGRIRLRELKLDFGPSQEETAVKLKEIGYDSILIDADIRFAYDEARQTLDFDLRIDGREMGLLTAELKAEGVSGALWTALTDGRNDEQTLKQEGALARLNKASFRYDGPSRRIAGALPVSVQSLTFDMSGADKDFVAPRRARMTMRGLAIDGSRIKNPETREMLAELGYNDLQANLEYQHAIDERSQKLEASMNIELVDMGSLRYEFELGGLGPLLSMASSQTLMERGPEGLAAIGVGALAMTVNNASLHYEDHSLASRMLTAAAKRRGLAEEEVRAELLNQLEARRREIPEKAAQQVFDAALSFIQKPGVIGVSLRPEPPASYAELAALALSGNFPALVARLKPRVESR